MNRPLKITLIAAIIVFIAGIALWPAIKRLWFDKDRIQEPAVPVTTSSQRALNVNATVLRYENLDDMFLTKGILLPDEEVDLSFETSGKITDIYFSEGTLVKKGQLLAKVNDRPLLAELQKLESQLPLAQDRLFRQRQLLEKDAVSQESYETVATDLETLRADIELVRARLAQTELRAPFDGMVGLRQVSEGAYASPTTIITRLTKITPLKIEFSVNERQANDIKPGTALTFAVGDQMQTYGATVYAVESRLDETMLTLRARALYDNPGGLIKPGHSASIRIKLREYEKSIVIPSMATIAEMGRDLVYVYRSGIARQVEITKGMRTASSVQVLHGLVPTDTLITTGVMQLREGMPVIITSIDSE